MNAVEAVKKWSTEILIKEVQNGSSDRYAGLLLAELIHRLCVEITMAGSEIEDLKKKIDQIGGVSGQG